MALDKNIKKELVQLCLNIQKARAEHSQKAMEEAQNAANEEEKSSAGDKYETSRAMSQNLRDMNARQLNEALKDLKLLEQIQPDLILTSVRTGAVVKTSDGNFFIVTSIGEIKYNQEKFFAISILSPVGQAMAQKQEGDEFIFRGKPVRILEII